MADGGAYPLIADDLLAVLKTASCGAYAVTLDQTIVFWNPAAERILGYPSDEVLGRRCYGVVKGVTPGGLTRECTEGCPSIRYLRAGLVPAASQLGMQSASGRRTWISVTPMVVAGLLKDAPLLVHLFHDEKEAEDSDQDRDLVRAALAAAGADILSERPAPPSRSKDAPALTPRELEVLRLVALGWETPRIAGQLGISRHTVHNHIRNLRYKLNATTKLDAVVTGIRLGILPVN